MRKRYTHRGHSIEAKDDVYTSIVAGRTVSGTMLAVKQCIDWWSDTHIFRHPSEFERQTFSGYKAQSTEQYKGFRIMRDDKQPGLWYIFVRGQLLKGPLPKIKQYIDQHSMARQA